MDNIGTPNQIKIVNDTCLAKDTRVFVMTRDGQEIDISRACVGATVHFDIDNRVTAELTVLVHKFESPALLARLCEMEINPDG